MIATSGDRSAGRRGGDRGVTRTIDLRSARLITPNLPALAALLDTGIATGEDEIERQGRQLLALGCRLS